MILPESEVQSWLPIAGVSLVCLPWLFWLLTLLYRIISRLCGIRVGGNYIEGAGKGGGGGGNGGGLSNATNTTGVVVVEAPAAESPVSSPQNGVRQVQFGASVVVGEQDNDQHGKGKHEKNNSSSSSRSSNDISSVASHESEMPLALSMAK
ncbi:putative Membrane lipoprotein [Quillaja saponaria]|uniref:Membrane lipoprotein n=1 Tax=Quillaja saponaria TaxID=32244 RepID=A0AAD7LF41_QUISA|nr:putative Membrane lipoprotein [Quillaja saponaria]